MAKARNYKGQNEKELNKFLSDIIGATNQGSRRAMVAIAQRGIHRLINNVAGFSDYTGVLINSYQAAILTRGKFNYKYGSRTGDFDARGQGLRRQNNPFNPKGYSDNVFKNGRGSTILLTSFRTSGTTPISFWTEGRKGTKIIKRKGRNPRSKPFIRNRWSKRTKEYQGFGMKTEGLRSYNSNVRVGYEVIFDNPAPYAESVQKHNDGSRVMPTGVANIMNRGLALSITSSEISREFIKRNKKRKR